MVEEVEEGVGVSAAHPLSAHAHAIPCQEPLPSAPHLYRWVMLPTICRFGKCQVYLLGLDALFAESAGVEAGCRCGEVRVREECLHDGGGKGVRRSRGSTLPPVELVLPVTTGGESQTLRPSGCKVPPTPCASEGREKGAGVPLGIRSLGSAQDVNTKPLLRVSEQPLTQVAQSRTKGMTLLTCQGSRVSA